MRVQTALSDLRLQRLSALHTQPASLKEQTVIVNDSLHSDTSFPTTIQTYSKMSLINLAIMRKENEIAATEADSTLAAGPLLVFVLGTHFTHHTSPHSAILTTSQAPPAPASLPSVPHSPHATTSPTSPSATNSALSSAMHQ